MKVEIHISEISDFRLSHKFDGGLITRIQFEARISPVVIARLLNLQRQGAISVIFSSDQAAMDLGIAIQVEKDGLLQQIATSDKEV